MSGAPTEVTWALELAPDDWIAVPARADEAWRTATVDVLRTTLAATASTMTAIDTEVEEFLHAMATLSVDQLMAFESRTATQGITVAAIDVLGRTPVPVLVTVATIDPEDPVDLMAVCGAGADASSFDPPEVEHLDVEDGDGIRVTRTDIAADGAITASVSVAVRTAHADVVLRWRTTDLPLITETRSSTDAWFFVLPEGWARFPLGEDRDAELDEAIEQVLDRVIPSDVPRDKALPVRSLVDRRLRAAIVDAQHVGASAIYLPIVPVFGVVVPASIVETEFVSDPGSDANEVARSVLTDDYDESEEIAVDGRPGVRLATSLIDVTQDDADIAFSSHQIVYVVNRDAERGTWVALSFSVLWNSSETRRLADALVNFFDAVMTTFRWVGDRDIPDIPAAAVPGSSSPKRHTAS